MERVFEIEYSPDFRLDLIEIADYIANQLFAPSSVEKLLHKIHTSIENLAYFPFSGTALPSKENATVYRWVKVENYMIFYTVDEEKEMLFISRVLFGASNYFSEIL